jgi:predicted DNA-binding protein
MPKLVKNYTFSLPIDLLERLKDYSNNGYVPSVNFAVKKAIDSYINTLEKQKLFNEMKLASEDPLFISDIQDALNDFSHADFEAIKETSK